MFTGQTLLYAIYVLAAAAVILAVEVVFITVSRRTGRTNAINRRLKVLVDDAPNEDTLRNLLQERGLTGTGDFSSGLISLNRLYTQSGITQSPTAFLLIHVMIAAMFAVALRLFGMPMEVSVLGFFVTAVLLPLLRLQRARLKRKREFEKQLPNALDMIVRSLRAGHPTNVAFNLVSREMPDPIGTEFGIVTDEITFGQSLEQAVKKLAERVGYEGIQLLAVSISIQSKTGGNLTEILQNLSKVLRDRAMLRMKIRSLSAEGRMSAILISLFPIIMLALLMIVAPTYYGDVWNDPIVTPIFVIFGAWALLGNYIMFRMVNFDF